MELLIRSFLGFGRLPNSTISKPLRTKPLHLYVDSLASRSETLVATIDM
jgi:hypothetical protein